jgi:HAD superfamily hydrolase (TIGR01490 family)
MIQSAYAFFDVDDTLIRTKSMFSFFRYWCQECARDPGLLLSFNAHFELARAAGAPREELNRDYYRFLAGIEPPTLATAGARWARAVIDEDLFHMATVTQLQKLMGQGVTPVFVSGSFNEVLEPIARHLGVSHILATKMLLGPDGLYTGEIGTPQTIGVGKALSIEEFLGRSGTLAAECWAFGDDVSDVPMLECVGHPVAVGSNPVLSATAERRQWPILDLAA